MEELISVAAYAKQHGTSVQSVYKRLKTTLKPYVVEVDGKKMLKSCVLDLEDSTVDKPEGLIKDNGSTTVKQPEPDITRDLLRLLEEQLKAKDAEIERLHGEVESARAAAAAAEQHNRDQAKQLTLLLEQSQELQRNNQLLLAAQATKNSKQSEVGEDPDLQEIKDKSDPPPVPDKKGFWARLFGL